MHWTLAGLTCFMAFTLLLVGCVWFDVSADARQQAQANLVEIVEHHENHSFESAGNADSSVEYIDLYPPVQRGYREVLTGEYPGNSHETCENIYYLATPTPPPEISM